MQAEKPKLYIVPSYIAALRHYEKLIPYLEERYDVRFLLIGGIAVRDYCEEKSLNYYILRQKTGSSKISLSNIPFITPVRDRIEFIKNCERFFEDEKPTKLIVNVPNRHFQLRVLTGLAKEKGVENIVLQWAFGGAENSPRHGRFYRLTRIKEYPSQIKIGLLTLHRWMVTFILCLSDKFSIGTKFLYGKFESDRFGVLTTAGRDLLISQGCSPEKIFIVGNIDVYHMYKLKDKVSKDDLYRDGLYKKFKLNPKKKLILNVSTTFHLPSTTKCMSFSEQISYFRRQFDVLRENFPDAELVFKIHPRENDIYSEAYKDLGVHVFGVGCSIEELMVLSDLYIAHPITSSTFSLRGLDTDAIFINFSPMTFIDAVGKYFSIKNIVHSEEEFLEKLNEYKSGILEKQYVPSAEPEKELESVLDFIG